MENNIYAAAFNAVSRVLRGDFRTSSDTGMHKRKNLNSSISPVSLPRMRQDMSTLRQAIQESEQAWYPQRYKLQQALNDTSMNGHVHACMQRRKDLTLLRGFAIKNKKGKDLDDLTALFEAEWFRKFVSYSLDSVSYGYQLIALGDMVDGEFPYLDIIKRENVSPDRYMVSQFAYGITGDKFLEPPYRKWHVYSDTDTQNGQSKCGLGLLTYCAPYEIYLRNLEGANADYVEMFAQPYRVGKSFKTEEAEVAELAESLQAMGSSGWAIIDPNDTIEFLETTNGSAGDTIYEGFGKRCKDTISKIYLGHANALDEVAGKLGGGQGEDNPVYQALRDVQVTDGVMIENLVNTSLIPRLRELGWIIPNGAYIEYSNNEELEAYRRKVDESNKVTADIAQTMSLGGLQMDAKYFEERTGIPTVQVEIETPPDESKELTANIQNRLNTIYNVHKH